MGVRYDHLSLEERRLILSCSMVSVKRWLSRKINLAWGSSMLPAAVSPIPRGRRSKSGAPTVVSSMEMLRVSAGG